jgi:hypothetical protein
VLRDEMIVYKKYLGQLETSNSIRSLLAQGKLVPIDSWSELGLTYEKYDVDDLKRIWKEIIKSPGGLEDLTKVPTEGTWGILYEDQASD